MKKLYVTRDCPHCEKAIELLHTRPNDVQVSVLCDEEEEERRAHITHLLKHKIPVVPVLEVEEGFLVGYDEEKYRRYIWQNTELGGMFYES